MKNLNNALQKGNLTPKERVLLLVHDAVKKETTGKGVLSETEKHAISDGWQPANNEQVKEYNRYHKGWRTAGFAELDAQTAFLDTQIIYFEERQASNHLLLYPFFRDAKKWVERLDDVMPVDINRALEIAKKQREVKLKDGLDFDYAVYQLAFESLPKPLQEDLQTEYEEVAYDHQYLDEEEILYDLFKGKDKLTAEDKEKLADMIVKRAYNKFAKEWQLWHYFASIPRKEIARRWMDKRGITPTPLTDETDKQAFEFAREKIQEVRKIQISPEEAEKELFAENLRDTLLDYAKDHKTTVEAELKAVTLEWLDHGLLDEYTPMFKATDTKAYNGETKLPHNELFKKWIEAKAEARNTLDRLIKEGQLKREGDTITGESLYSFKGNYQFIKKQKEHIDEYQANLGIVYADDDPEHKGQHLDRELLITTVDKDGKRGFNFSQIAMARIKGYFDTMEFVKEIEVNGERVIEFTSDNFRDLMIRTTGGLKKHYAILITFRELFKRLSKTYNIDLTYKINKWIKVTEEFIDNHNKAIEEATKKPHTEIMDKKKIRLKDDLFIDKAKIQPDQERVKEYFKDLEDTLGEDF